VKQVIGRLSGEYDVVMVARADGGMAADVRPLVHLAITVIAEQDGRREQGHQGAGGASATPLHRAMLEQLARDAVRQALVNLEARPAPGRPDVVVLGPGWPGILLHEAIGHGLEGDFNRKGTSAFSGAIGERVAAPGVTVIDDGTIPDRRGSLSIDDEGNPARATSSSRTASCAATCRTAQRAPHGRSGHRQRPARVVRQHPDAAHDQHLHARRRQGSAEIVASLERGLYA
jgi:TldD protein